jgi:hypothetical protein
MFWKTSNLHQVTQNFPLFVEKCHYYAGPMKRFADWPSLWLPNRHVRVKWNRVPYWVTPWFWTCLEGTCLICITTGRWAFTTTFFFVFPPLFMLSKQSTQGVQVLKDNSSYGLFQLVLPVWTKELHARVIWVRWFLYSTCINLHLKAFYLPIKTYWMRNMGPGVWKVRRASISIVSLKIWFQAKQRISDRKNDLNLPDFEGFGFQITKFFMMSSSR